jgi:hypothetical protein
LRLSGFALVNKFVPNYDPEIAHEVTRTTIDTRLQGISMKLVSSCPPFISHATNS